MTEKKTEQKLTPSRFSSAEHKRSVWSVVSPSGISIEDLLKPSFWSHVCMKFNVGSGHDIVEVMCEDGSFFAVFIVMQSYPPTGAKLQLLYSTKIEQIEQGGAEIGDFDIKWINMHAGFRVSRKSDGIKLQDGFKQREDAIKWAIEHSKALAA